jgi:hypothetical protein
MASCRNLRASCKAITVLREAQDQPIRYWPDRLPPRIVQSLALPSKP